MQVTEIKVLYGCRELVMDAITCDTLTDHDTFNVTNARNDLYNLINSALDHGLVTITTKDGNAVLMFEEDWEGIKETLHLMGDPDFIKDVEEARNAPDSDFEAWN